MPNEPLVPPREPTALQGGLHARTDAVLRRLVRRDAVQPIRKVLARIRPADLAAAMEHLTASEQRRLYRMVDDKDYAAEVVANLSREAATEITRQLDRGEVVDLLERMEPDDATDIVEALPEEMRVGVLLDLEENDDATDLQQLLAWPRDSAGGIMSPLVFKVGHQATCGEAIRLLQSEAEHLESIYYVYVSDPGNRLIGVSSLRGLLTHPSHTPIVQIMATDVISVGPTQDQEEVARLVAHYDLMAIPVVDDQKHLLGVVTVDDVVHVIKEEAAEDMMRMAGVSEDADAHQGGVLQQVRYRAPWLVATIFGGIVASEIIAGFQDFLQGAALIGGFIPVVMGMGGNVGTQSATVTVRGLATGRVQIGGAFTFVRREAAVGGTLGLLFGVFLGGYALLRFFEEPMVGVSVGVSVLIAMTTATVLGSSVPLILQRLGVDPAFAAGPFVTTGVDILGIIVYFNVARLLLAL